MPLHNSRGNCPALLALPVPANRHTVLHNDPHGRSAPEDVQMLLMQVLRERPEQMLLWTGGLVLLCCYMETPPQCLLCGIAVDNRCVYRRGLVRLRADC